MFFLLLALWLLLNGRVTVEVLIIGVILSAVLYWASYKLLGVRPKWELSLFKRSIKAIKYLFLLVWNVLVSNVQVMGVILSPKANKLKPRLVWFDSPLKSNVGEVILANSITLTPGTITAGLSNGQYCIHALDESFAGGMDESDFVKAIAKMEE
ncbi:MAG: Na+/H+ antiporter subunit E [Oscillospiraceae bacterium]|nr:Na+/H+ antiporter subunit E [Oscillospiraceae bacterium]